MPNSLLLFATHKQARSEWTQTDCTARGLSVHESKASSRNAACGLHSKHSYCSPAIFVVGVMMPSSDKRYATPADNTTAERPIQARGRHHGNNLICSCWLAVTAAVAVAADHAVAVAVNFMIACAASACSALQELHGSTSACLNAGYSVYSNAHAVRPIMLSESASHQHRTCDIPHQKACMKDTVASQYVIKCM
jgi:hypothetical protein